MFLLDWFRNWRKRRQRRRAEKERLLFSFWDGTAFRRVDPFRTWRSLCTNPKFDLVKHGPMMDAGIEPETTIGLTAICEAFGIERWCESTGRGLTDMEIMDLCDVFTVWLEEVKKKFGQQPTSSPPTAGESSIAPVPPPAPTNSTSGSGSAPSEPSAAAATTK